MSDAEEGLTIDELSAAVGLTVRTTRYYASRGLIPAPVKRGRVAYYGPDHRARLELVRALQDHGFTLQAIDRFLADLPVDAGVEELAAQRVMLTSWTGSAQPLSAAELTARAGRRLAHREVELLVRLGVLERAGRGYLAGASLDVGLGLLELDVPEKGLAAAAEAIERHMAALVGELTDVLREQVIAPYRRGPTPDDAARLEEQLPRLRELTLAAVVAGFQRAANEVIVRALGAEGDEVDELDEVGSEEQVRRPTP